MKTSELRKKSVKDLQQELEGLHREQFNLRMQKGSSQFVATHQLTQVRRNIARVKTIIHEMEGATDNG